MIDDAFRYKCWTSFSSRSRKALFFKRCLYFFSVWLPIRDFLVRPILRGVSLGLADGERERILKLEDDQRKQWRVANGR